jgi:transglutaminase-like putative cysteine protease
MNATHIGHMDKYKIAAAGGWVAIADIDISRNLDTSSPYYYYLVDYQERVTDGAFYAYKRTLARVNDASHIEDASLFLFELQDNNHQIVLHAVDIIRDGVRSSVLTEENISVMQRERSLENHITDNRETVSLSIDDLRVGDIIDFRATEITRAGDHPLNGRFYNTIFWIDWNCPVYLQKVRIVNESQKGLQAQYCTYRDGAHSSVMEYIKPDETLEKAYENLSSMSFEEVTPAWLWPDFLLATTSSQWEELSAYLFGYYRSHGALESSVNIADLDVYDPAKTVEQNIIGITRFVQNEIRYKGENHGIFTHTPKPAEQTLTKRYGDCKDKSNLLVILLKQINVEACLTLVNTDYGIKINQLSPSLYHFNHVVVHITHNGKDYFFDPTIKKQAGDLEHSTTFDYGYGLDLKEQGASLTKLKHDITKDVFKLKHVFDFSRGDADKKLLKIIRTYYAHRADNMRYYLESTASRKLAEDFYSYAKEEIDPALNLERPITVVNDDIKRNVLQTEEIYSFNDSSADSTDGQLHVPTNIYTEFPVTTNKSMPLRIDIEGRVTHDIEVMYKTEPLIPVEKASISNKWFCYQDSILRKGNTLYLSATAVPKRKYVNCEDVESYLSDVEVMRQRSVNNFSRYSSDHSRLKSLGSWMIFTSAFLAIIALIVSKLS